VSRGPAWVLVGAGRLAVGHRPRMRTIPHLPKEGCHRVWTLLSEREGAEEIGSAVRAAGMAWTWLPLADARPPEGRRNADRVRAALEEVSAALDAGESVLLHCSAGLHRTGMIAYALLRRRGLGPAAALDALEALRPLARAEVTPERLEWADGLIDGGR